MKNHDELNFIYWFSYYNDGFPSVRYRAKYPLNYLKTNYGINYYLVTPGYSIKKIIVFIRAYISALLFRKTNSLIVIQKINSDFIYARLLKFLIKIQNKFTVYDLDDADYLEYPPETILYFIKNCKMVTAGSHELVFDLKHLNTNILLNTSPVPDLKLVKQKKNNILTIGWIGGFGGEHKESLINNFFPALFEIPIPMKLIIMGVVKETDHQFLNELFSPCKHIQLEIPRNINWSDETILQENIITFDIGIATLMDSEFHRSKSAFKAKQYLNNGIPVLSSDLPENNYFIINGFNGFLCSSLEDFQQRILQINFMTEGEYNLISHNARNSRHQFSLENYCKVLTSLYTLKGQKKTKSATV